MRMDWYIYDSAFTATFYLKMICVNLATMPRGLGQTSNYLFWIPIAEDNHCENAQTIQSQNLIPDFPPNPSTSFSKHKFLPSVLCCDPPALPAET